MISEIRTAFCLVTTAASQGEKGQSENDASPMMLSLSKKKKNGHITEPFYHPASVLWCLPWL